MNHGLINPWFTFKDRESSRFDVRPMYVGGHLHYMTLAFPSESLGTVLLVLYAVVPAELRNLRQFDHDSPDFV